jgi:cytidylate kinase
LLAAPDALVIDTTHLGRDQAINAVVDAVCTRLGAS